MRALHRFLLTCLAGSLATALLAVSGPAPARDLEPLLRNPIGSDPFQPGRIYRGDFPDPSVLRWGGTWYAYSTSIANLNLPVLRGGLTNWYARGTNPATGSPDALTAVAKWAEYKIVGKRRVGITWAPSVARVAGRFEHVYATRVRGTDKMCISASTSDHPIGPYVDRSDAPLICPSDRGVIDPMIFMASTTPYLFYKTEDVALGQPARLLVRRLSPNGLVVPQSLPATVVLTASEAWERSNVENPAMIRYRDQLYLFYSGNGYASPDYAVGYARCDTVRGPCVRVGDGRLLVGGTDISGPGGAHPFIDTNGRLRIAYHAWDAGNVGYPSTTDCKTTVEGCAQRRLYVATLGVRADGTLRVANRGTGSTG